MGSVLPILAWAPRYQRSWLRPDLIAGLTVAALVVPKALGYADIAQVPIQYGLYAAAGTILSALFCTSRQISTEPSAALSAVAAGAVLGAAASGNQADSQGAEKVGDVLKLTRAQSAELRLARVKLAVMDVLRRDGVVDRLGESNICGNVFEASKDLIAAVEGREGISTTVRAATDDGSSGRER